MPPSPRPSGGILHWVLLGALLLTMGGLALTPAAVHAPNQRLHSTAAAAGAAAPVTLTPPAAPAATAKPAPAYSEAWLQANPSPELGVAARAAILVDLDTRQILWEREPHSRRAPASLTKIITVMVALDHLPMEAELTVPAEAVDSNPEDTVMGLDAGERVTIRELLYGIFLVSGNDAAETLARAIIPRERFIAEMNVKAARLGLADTNFTDPTGLGSRAHFSSAYDQAVAAGYFEAHYPGPAFIAGLQGVTLYANEGHKEFQLYNLNKLLTWPYPGATGLKTGFTGQAGGCVAATAERGGHHLMVVVLGSSVFFTDAARLFDYGWQVV